MATRQPFKVLLRRWFDPFLCGKKLWMVFAVNGLSIPRSLCASLLQTHSFTRICQFMERGRWLRCSLTVSRSRTLVGP